MAKLKACSRAAAEGLWEECCIVAVVKLLISLHSKRTRQLLAGARPGRFAGHSSILMASGT